MHGEGHEAGGEGKAGKHDLDQWDLGDSEEVRWLHRSLDILWEREVGMGPRRTAMKLPFP